MGRLVLTGIRDDEISVELDPLASIQVGRSLPEIATQIGAAMDDGPAGTVLGADRIDVRGVGREESVEAISGIRISGPGGSWPLSDLASVDATFDDTPIAPATPGWRARSHGNDHPWPGSVIKMRSTLPGWCVRTPRVAAMRQIAISLD